MELKWVSGWTPRAHDSGSNRTFMELKLLKHIVALQEYWF